MKLTHELSTQEAIVLKHSWDALTVKETADRMRLSEKTVKNYRRNIFEKFAVSNVEGMLRQGVERGYIDATTRVTLDVEWP